MKFLYGTIALLGIILLVAAVMPKSYSIVTEIEIARPQREVWDYVKLIKNQKDYSVRYKIDPNMELSYSGTDNTVGFLNYWSGNSDAGEGKQTITNISDGESFEVKIEFVRPFKSISFATTNLEKITNQQTKIVSTLSGHDNWPINFLTPLFIKPALRKDMDQNLKNIKNILEGSGSEISNDATLGNIKDSLSFQNEKIETIKQQKQISQELAGLDEKKVIAQGTFQYIDRSGWGKGKIIVVPGEEFVYFITERDFQVSRSPDSYLLLSQSQELSGKKIDLSKTITLGPLTSSSGRQLFKIDKKTRELYNHSIIIRSKEFDMHVTNAPLIK